MTQLRQAAPTGAAGTPHHRNRQQTPKDVGSVISAVSTASLRRKVLGQKRTAGPKYARLIGGILAVSALTFVGISVRVAEVKNPAASAPRPQASLKEKTIYIDRDNRVHNNDRRKSTKFVHNAPITGDRPLTASDIASSRGPRLFASRRKQLQVGNYINGTGLLVNVHITHVGGTTFCNVIGRAPGANSSPPFACMLLKRYKDNITTTLRSAAPEYPEYDFPRDPNPWAKNETDRNIAIVRRFFHMVAWEFQKAPNRVAVEDADWENPNIVSVIIMRDPISRLLAKDGYTTYYYPDISKGTASHKEWQAYADYDKNTNNYALRILAGGACCDGERTDRKYLEKAKSVMQRFTFVLDIDCLEEGLFALAKALNITLTSKATQKATQRKRHKPNHERIPFRDVYDHLVRKNKLDIELYEWSKGISLVNCSAVEQNRTAVV